MNRLITIALASLLTACTALPAPKVEDTHNYLLDAKPLPETNIKKSERTILVGAMLSRPGFDTPRMAYLEKPLELEYFATHRWTDTPARMITPLIAQSLESGFKNVVRNPQLSDLRLDTELIRLQQDFTGKPVKIRLTLQAKLVSLRDKRVIASRLFDESEATESDTPYGGVVAANRALARLLSGLDEFCRNEARLYGESQPAP